MNQPELGMKVVELRLHSGMTQEQLAEAASVNVRTIQRIEKGETEPEVFTLNSLSDILEFNLRQEKNYDIWILLLHLSSILCIVVIPIVIWVCRKKQSSMIDKHGKTVLNFQLTMTILLFGAGLLMLAIPVSAGILNKNGFLDLTEQSFVILLALPVIFLAALGF